MGQVPAKQFPQPAPFGDSQLNTIRQAQAPDKIQQQALPSLNVMTQGTGSMTSPGVQQAAKVPSAISNVRRATLGQGPFGRLFGINS